MSGQPWVFFLWLFFNTATRENSSDTVNMSSIDIAITWFTYVSIRAVDVYHCFKVTGFHYHYKDVQKRFSLRRDWNDKNE